MADDRVDEAELAELYIEMRELVGVRLDLLRVPRSILRVLEPSQVGTIVGTLMDACIPELPTILRSRAVREPVRIFRHEGVVGEREGYPDYRHASGLRLELKLLYREPKGVEVKKPPTPREASARLTQKVTLKNVNPKTDVLMVVAYELSPLVQDADLCSPTIMGVGLFPMIDCILARDARLLQGGGKWFGNYETPCVPSKIGRKKRRQGERLDESTYGRKESEGKDFNEDTNFGKLRRIPYKPLQLFLKEHGVKFAAKATGQNRGSFSRCNTSAPGVGPRCMLGDMRVGVAHHFGWAVAVTTTPDFRVVDRRKIALIEPHMPSAPVHYHDKRLDDGDLATLVANVRASAVRATSASLDELDNAVAAPITSLSLRAWPRDFPSDIGVQRRSPYESRADSVMYREVLAECAHERGWEVHRFDAKNVERLAANLLGGRVHDVLHGPRATLGPPWTKDHRIALAATIMAHERIAH